MQAVTGKSWRRKNSSENDISVLQCRFSMCRRRCTLNVDNIDTSALLLLHSCHCSPRHKSLGLKANRLNFPLHDDEKRSNSICFFTSLGFAQARRFLLDLGQKHCAADLECGGQSHPRCGFLVYSLRRITIIPVNPPYKSCCTNECQCSSIFSFAVRF